MSTTTHQGAVGAETMTAAERVCHEEQMTIWSSEMAERLAMGGWLREHLSYEDKLGFYADLSEGIRDIVESALDLSTPAPRTDGGMTAGEALREAALTVFFEGESKPWHFVVSSQQEACKEEWRRRLDRVLALATPAQPAGAVPDGLRALSDLQFYMDDCDAGFAKVSRQRLAEWKALLASHPAGQSAGSGAERWRCPECGCREYARVDQRQPGGNYAPGPLVRCVECKDVFNAPDSTRTGQGEADVRHIDVFGPVNGMNELDPSGSYMRLVLTKGEIREERLISLGAAKVFNAVLDGKLWAAGDSPLAARPAAPEAQGAWQPIETAPPNKAVQVYVPNHDYYGNEGVYAGMLVDMGTGQRWMTFAWAMGRDMCGDSRPTHWRPLPAPPSSGQGGR